MRKKIFVRCLNMRECDKKSHELANILYNTYKIFPTVLNRYHHAQVKTDKVEVTFCPLTKKISMFHADVAIGFDHVDEMILTRGNNDTRWDNPLNYILEEHGMKVEE